jgi:hypothetical protein
MSPLMTMELAAGSSILGRIVIVIVFDASGAKVLS